MGSKPTKELLAEALREHPTWGHAYVAEKERADAAFKLLLSIEGMFLGYWTDVPQASIQAILPQIRELLGGWEPI